LVASLGGQTEDAGAAQALDAMSPADLKIVLRGIEGVADGDLLALLQGLASRFLDDDDQEFDLSEAELTVGVVGFEGVDLFDGVEDRLRDEWGAVGPLFNPASKQAVEGFGIEPSLTELLLEEFGSHHQRHLRSETQHVH